MNKKKSPILILGGIGIIFISFSLFTPTEQDELHVKERLALSNQYNKALADSTSMSEFKDQLEGKFGEEVEVQLEQEAVISSETPIPSDLNYFSMGSPQIDAVNLEIYAIAHKNMEHDLVTSQINNPHLNALMILASARTEYNDFGNDRLNWVPALPSKFMTAEQVNVETLKTFNMTQAIRLEGWARKASMSYRNGLYQGPLQFNTSYGLTTPASKTDRSNIIHKSEEDAYNADIEAKSIRNGSAMKNAPKRYIDDGKNSGDRTNWNDITSLAWIQWAYEYDYDKRHFDRVSKIDHQGELTAWIAMNHNMGSAISTESDSFDRNSLCSGCNNKEAWEFLYYMGTDNASGVLQAKAKSMAETFKSGGTVTHANEAELIASIRQNESDSNSIIHRITPTYEGVFHVMRLSVWYYYLYELYYNGGTQTSTATSTIETTPEEEASEEVSE